MYQSMSKSSEIKAQAHGSVSDHVIVEQILQD